MKNLIAITILFPFLTFANDEYKLPEHTGNWYIYDVPQNYNRASLVTRRDTACYDSYEYDYQYISSNMDYLIEQSKILLPKHANCEWSKEEEKNIYWKPYSYPYISPSEELLPLKGIKYGCKDKENNVISYTEFYIEPEYICPAGTRVSFGKGNHCVTHAEGACPSDVLGRDLKWDSKLKFVGHLGLSAGEEVIEVEAKPRHAIEINNIKDFMGTEGTKFWGARYGYQEKRELNNHDSMEIYYAALEQTDYDSSYAYSWAYQPGMMLDVAIYDYFREQTHVHNIEREASFRCDTFVKYSYLKGANINLSGLSPYTIFKHFKGERIALPEISLLPEYLNQKKINVQRDIKCEDRHCFEKKIEGLFKLDRPLEEIFKELILYKDYLDKNDVFNEYLKKLINSHYLNEKFVESAIQYLSMNKPSLESIRYILSLYKNSNKLLLGVNYNLNIISSFKTLFVYDTGKIFSQYEIEAIQEANHILISAIESLDYTDKEYIEKFEVYSSTAFTIMEYSKAQEVLIGGLSKMGSTKAENKIRRSIAIQQIFNNKIENSLSFFQVQGLERALSLKVYLNDISNLNQKTKEFLFKYFNRIRLKANQNNLTRDDKMNGALAFKALKKLNSPLSGSRTN